MANYKILLVFSVVICLGESDSGNTVLTAPSLPQQVNNQHPAPVPASPPHVNQYPAAVPASPAQGNNQNPAAVAPSPPQIINQDATPEVNRIHIAPGAAVPDNIPDNNTTTPSPTNTTTAPNTTTVAPSTPKPTPSPSPAPTTTSAPTTVKPIPDPSVGNWTLNYPKTNQSCLVIDAALQIEILRVNSTSKKIDVPTTAVATGKCGDTSDVLNLDWENNTLTLNFGKKINATKFELDSITFTMVLDPNNTKVLIHNTSEFPTEVQHSYKCAKLQSLNFTSPSVNGTVGYLHISHAQFQAFSNVTGHKFNDAIDCEASHVTSDVVPVVVGCVLAVLVVVILVAYLFGRRRCQARGYFSM